MSSGRRKEKNDKLYTPCVFLRIKKRRGLTVDVKPHLDFGENFFSRF